MRGQPPAGSCAFRRPATPEASEKAPDSGGGERLALQTFRRKPNRTGNSEREAGTSTGQTRKLARVWRSSEFAEGYAARQDSRSRPGPSPIEIVYRHDSVFGP